MMGVRNLLLFCATLLFAFAYVAVALPIPAESGVVKKELKQFKAKRGEMPTRVARGAKLSARGANKRDEALFPKPSKYYRRAA
ncbi:hypothetical protein GGX14DRAFT_670654 [Mycena pura]|uniref:Uncharacterized protein n=1 Tax=Mycena pura TaxID=153505 RepID=A0AAD6YI73_9AGAR|nr:hypothetical protein GGX14DRAFT_670654 [Mycena pura]